MSILLLFKGTILSPGPTGDNHFITSDSNYFITSDGEYFIVQEA